MYTPPSLFSRAVSMISMLALVLSTFATLVPTPASAAAPNWDISGSYVINFNLSSTDYPHNVSLSQDGAGTLSGGGTSAPYAWAVTAGSVDGDTVNFSANYTATADAVTPQTTMNVTGTIAPGGAMSGTWSDNYSGGSRSGTWATTHTATAIVAPPSSGVGTEEFATVDGSYKGVSVGFNTTDITDATAVTVVMTRADGSTVTKTANQGVLDIINAGGLQHLTAPFVIQEGSFTEASDTLYWDPAPATWTSSTRPTSVTITVTTGSGDLSATNSTFNDGAPSWPTYESLLPPVPPTTTSQTVVVSGNTASAENQPGWLFNRDASTQTPFEFITGTSSIGAGSLYVPPIQNNLNGNNDKFVGELFVLAPIANVKSVSYDFQIASGTVADKDQFYMNVYANFGESSPTKFYDCRYNVVPTTGSTSGFTTVTFDPALTYPVTTRGGASPSPHVCPASPSGMDALTTGSSTIRVVALNVGDTSASDLGVGGYLDRVVVVTNVNSNTDTTTYDFDPVPVTPTPPAVDNGGGGGNRRNGSSGSSNNNNGGQVLGAATGPDAVCSTPLFNSFMRIDRQNNTAQVILLQWFLNGEVGSALPLSGIFDASTEMAVKTFQTKYASEILAPWGLSSPTGWFYKLSQWKSNIISCAGINLPKPAAVIDPGDL